MSDFSYSFTYESDRLAELQGLESCPRVTVSVSYTVYKTHAYDTPFGPSPTQPAVGFSCVTDLYCEGLPLTPSDLLRLRDADDDFATEVIRQVDEHELDLLEHARGEEEL